VTAPTRHKNDPCPVEPIVESVRPNGARLRLVTSPVVEKAEPAAAAVESPTRSGESLSLLDQALLGMEPRPLDRAADVALRVLRQVSGTRPPLLLPVSVNARAAGTAAVVEMRTRVATITAEPGDRPAREVADEVAELKSRLFELTGETEHARPPREVADEVLRAATPFIQRDLVNRVFADRLWMTGMISGCAVAAGVGFAVAAVYAVVAGAAWLSVVLGFSAAAVGWCTWQMAAAVRHQVDRARSIADAPLTGQKPDEAASTVDLATAVREGR
jgi:hypothetical protein